MADKFYHYGEYLIKICIIATLIFGAISTISSFISEGFYKGLMSFFFSIVMTSINIISAVIFKFAKKNYYKYKE